MPHSKIEWLRNPKTKEAGSYVPERQSRKAVADKGISRGKMRIVIENGIEGYHEVILEVASWFCEKEGIIHNTASVIKQTDLAILLRTGDKEVWIPKSLIEVHPIPKGLEAFQ